MFPGGQPPGIFCPRHDAPPPGSGAAGQDFLQRPWRAAHLSLSRSHLADLRKSITQVVWQVVIRAVREIAIPQVTQKLPA